MAPLGVSLMEVSEKLQSEDGQHRVVFEWCLSEQNARQLQFIVRDMLNFII